MAAQDADGLRLDDEERDVVGSEVQALLPALSGSRRDAYDQLAAAVAAGVVPNELEPLLTSVLELSLQTACARQLYRAEGERLLTAVFRRTQRGRDVTAQLEQVNAALRSLSGQPLDAVTVGMRTLGHFTVTVRTTAATIGLSVRSDGVSVDSLAVGGPADTPA